MDYVNKNTFFDYIYKIDVTNSDTNGGYTYETPPLVTISGGSGSNATATAHVEDGSVTKITVTHFTWNRNKSYS